MQMIDVTKWEEFYKEMTDGLKPYNHYDDGYRDAMDNVDDWMEGKQVEAEPDRNRDVVEVVRCKDCKYYRNEKHFTDINFCQRLPYYAEKGGLNTSDDDFCSLGERKEK